MAAGGEHAFDFLNRSRVFPDGKVDWRCPGEDKLWRYNLHYFDYLLDADRSFENASALIDDWIRQNPPGTVDAWEPFPASLRVVNWIKFFLRPDVRERVKPHWHESTYRQLSWLERNVERHLLANHYFKNGKALFFGGIYFEGPDAARWLEQGRRILSAEIGEQILPDGGHFERSPMYHAMILADVLDLMNLAQGRVRQDLRVLAGRLRENAWSMLSFLLGTSHPDGGIALFNDAAFGVEAAPVELVRYHERLTGERINPPNDSVLSFPQTGYYIMAPAPGDRLIIDCGEVGPDYQPGHSHCDTLSFELSLSGRRVIVDSGCAQYADGEIRRYTRGNAGHNTVTIDGENQSEVWGAHRCARRARPLRAALSRRPDGSLHFEGAHDGYRRLPGSPIHTRAVAWSGKTISIDDRIDGRGTHFIGLRLHVHPDLAVIVTEGKARVLAGDSTIASISAAGAGRIERAEGLYCPEFGKTVPCPLLVVVAPAAPLPFRGGWRIDLPESLPNVHPAVTRS
jgi:uncharacterized heparinase superfamily protein